MTLEERYKKKQDELKGLRKELQKKKREEDKKRQAAEEKQLIEKGKKYDDLMARYDNLCKRYEETNNRLRVMEGYMQGTPSGQVNLTVYDAYFMWQQEQQKKQGSPEGAQRPSGPQ